jgi:Tfp pilus assembly PilM family ATPase
MNLFPINQPTVALSISEEALHLVEVKKSWRRTTLEEVKRVSLPSGVIRLSSAKPNIENMETFVEQLRILAEPLKTPVSISLSLPDLCARTSVFDFSTFPTKKKEQTALLNWRFQQDLKLDTGQSRLSYAVYVPTSLANASKQENPEKVRVLGTAIRNEIVEQYERACLDLNLMPVSVSISGLAIFDLYQSTIQDILEVEDRRTTNPSSGGMFLFISHWGFTFFAFHEGCPSFARTKAITIRPNSSHVPWDASISESENQENVLEKSGEDVQQVIDSQDTRNGDSSTHPYSSYTATKVEKEILATLQYYLETFSQNDSTPSLANLFVVSDLEHGHMLLPTSEGLQQMAKVSGLSVSDIQVTQLSYSTHFNKRESRFVQESYIWAALPGYASLRVA